MTHVSRRGFLAGTAGLTLMISLPPLTRRAAAQGSGVAPNVFVTIGTDDRVRIYAPAAEMGQGVMTSLPVIIAEELDADWEKVDIDLAPIAPGFGNPGFGNLMVTGASRTTQGYWPLLRQSGAQARRVLMDAAATEWGVERTGLTTEPSVIVHPDGRRMSYGEAAALATVPAELPEIPAEELKPRADWRLIGSTVPRRDIPQKTRGEAKFGIDQNLEGQLYATIVRAPVNGASPDQVDDTAAMESPGVVSVVPLPYGVAILAENFDEALAARDLLDITWTGGRADGYDSDAVMEEFLALAADRGTAGVVHALEDDPAAALEAAATVLTRDFGSDHVHHATLEPQCALANVGADTAEVWAPSQAPGIAQFAVAGLLKVDPAQVTVHQTLIGGGFGRKVDIDYVIDAVLLSQQAGRPVKVIWTREDDVQHDKYRPLTAQRIEAALDVDNNITGWRHRIVADSINARFRPDGFAESGGKDETVVEGGHTFYAVGPRELDYVYQDKGIDVGFWRAVGTGYTKFAIEQVIDEVAALRGEDPLEYRISLLAEDPRGQAVLRKAAEMAGWPRAAEENRAWGIGFSDDWNTRIAEIVEIELDRETGEIRVPQIWAAVDPGVAVQIDNTKAQVEGGAIFGVSAALKEKITVKDGAVQESNFYDYLILRHSEAPVVHVEVLQSVDEPGGMGEVSLPPVAPAIANAFAVLTGKRLQRLPMLPERVLEVLAS